MPHIRDIQIRDPFILLENDSYYLFGSTDKDIWKSAGVGFDMYISRPHAGYLQAGLEEFDGPFPCFRPQENFWSKINFWAPEVYRYNNEYYMFATFKPVQGRRGTAVLKTQSLDKYFLPWSDGPVTPPDWECLDGTLYVDEQQKPWMIFCHEWQQVTDGEICIMPLTDDLKKASGSPHLLFKASEAPWASEFKGRVTGFVTDGPFLYTAKNGNLLMLWSSFGPDGKYRIGLAVSESSRIEGPWKQQNEPLYSADGGHGMLFHSIEGKLYLAIHSPNNSPNERPVFIEMIEENGLIRANNLSPKT
ncbi:MAG: glycoside hydrolase family 43 protein [Treponema sp.]|nr:glycoside hydrolase family 43 protein [Treponema sp.]